MSWKPIASHGMTEAQVRQALDDALVESVQPLPEQLRAEGLPPAVIEKVVASVLELGRKQLEERLPMIMRNMAMTAGAASSH